MQFILMPLNDNYPQAGDYDFNDIVLNVNLPAAGNDVKGIEIYSRPACGWCREAIRCWFKNTRIR